MLDHTKLNELRSHEFSRSIRGYSPGEVDEFVEFLLAEAAQLVEALQEKDLSLKGIEEEREGMRHREEALSATLVAAQTTAEEWKALARKEADQMIREARFEADKRTTEARSETEELIRQARQKWREEEESRSQVRHELALRIARVKGEFSALKEALERWEKNESQVGEGGGDGKGRPGD